MWQNVLEKTIKLWRMELTCDAETLAKVGEIGERDFSRGCASTILVCNCLHTSDSHTANS